MNALLIPVVFVFSIDRFIFYAVLPEKFLTRHRSE